MKNKTKGLLAAYGMVLPAFLVVMLTSLIRSYPQ